VTGPVTSKSCDQRTGPFDVHKGVVGMERAGAEWTDQRVRRWPCPGRKAPAAGTVANSTASTSAQPMTAPASPPGGLAGAITRSDQEAVGLIAIVSFFAFSGSGIVTSTTPSCVFAVIFVASTPVGSAIERRKDP
jgi:hypothetical protein